MGHNSNEDRLEYLYLNMVGQVVQIHTIDGAVTEGVFVSRTDPETPMEEAGVFLRCTRFLQSKQHEADSAVGFSAKTCLFLYKDMMLLEATPLKIRSETPGMGNVYGYRGERDLKTLDWADEGSAADMVELDKMAGGEWDQFKANERFGVKSTYSEEYYTTKLDRTKITREQIEYADNIAKSIESAPVRGVQHQTEREDMVSADVDEGTLFSDVARDQKSSKRGGYASGPAAARKAEPKAVPTKRAVPESEPAGAAAFAGRDFNPNPEAQPFVPTRPIINDYLKSIAQAIAMNPGCFTSESDWPGEEDRVTDHREERYPAVQPTPQPAQHVSQYMPQQPHQYHQHHHQHQHHQGFGMPTHHREGGHHVHQGQVPYGAPMGGYGANGQQSMRPSHIDPNMPPMGGAGPSSASRIPPMQQPQSVPPSQQPPQSRAKGSQPQQPVVALSVQGHVSPPQPQQQPAAAPPPPTVMPTVDGTGGIDKPQPKRALKRGGGGGNAPRTEAAEGGKKGGK